MKEFTACQMTSWVLVVGNARIAGNLENAAGFSLHLSQYGFFLLVQNPQLFSFGSTHQPS
ncbi:MAG: hypothetical protein COC19_00975 [SAR86 cluster bacterium]|uniref:Uncharacterized protein n=1 Tax=SAR86 cluster bacterium TaxID=2030880 RepID=A0A2A4MTV1_9GAMM|nr:MAG: hypothetical protein COC19_00975 [SAR86 cluster bacterium]